MVSQGMVTPGSSFSYQAPGGPFQGPTYYRQNMHGLKDVAGRRVLFAPGHVSVPQQFLLEDCIVDQMSFPKHLERIQSLLPSIILWSSYHCPGLNLCWVPLSCLSWHPILITPPIPLMASGLDFFIAMTTSQHFISSWWVSQADLELSRSCHIQLCVSLAPRTDLESNVQ